MISHVNTNRIAGMTPDDLQYAKEVLKDSIIAEIETEEIIEWFTYGLIKEKGKIRKGLGDNSLGDVLPGLFSQLNLRDIRTYISDKAIVINPPGSSGPKSRLGPMPPTEMPPKFTPW